MLLDGRIRFYQFCPENIVGRRVPNIFMMIKCFFFCKIMSRVVFKEMWKKITYIGLSLIVSCNKTTEMSEIQQLISEVIDNFFCITRG